VVWYDHGTMGSSSVHEPLAPSSHFFRLAKMTLLAASA